MGNPGGLMPSPWTFKKYGQSGWTSRSCSRTSPQHVDDIAFIRSMYA